MKNKKGQGGKTGHGRKKGRETFLVDGKWDGKAKQVIRMGR
jgi:hypothetical protein